MAEPKFKIGDVVSPASEITEYRGEGVVEDIVNYGPFNLFSVKWNWSNRTMPRKWAGNNLTLVARDPLDRDATVPAMDLNAQLDGITPDSPLQRALELVHGDRGRDYDHPHVDYSRTADIFRAMTGIELTVSQAVQFMIAVKLSRFQASPEVADHLVDLAGYTECLHMVLEKEADLKEPF